MPPLSRQGRLARNMGLWLGDGIERDSDGATVTVRVSQ